MGWISGICIVMFLISWVKVKVLMRRGPQLNCMCVKDVDIGVERG